VTAAQFQRFLHRWQHLVPSNCRATKSPPPRGSLKFWRGALHATSPTFWINCACRAK
jgi:hypothetical protein